MNSRTHSNFSPQVQQKYRDNFARHLLNVSLYIQSGVMNALTQDHGHQHLRINFEPYVAIAASGGGARLSDIADMLGISRQAANQTANQIEKAGYLRREADPSDGRAKLLRITPRGEAMIRQGSAEFARLEQSFGDILGKAELAELTASAHQLASALGLLLPYQENISLALGASLPRLSDYITQQLQALTMAKGHPLLKRSFGQVLTAIGPRGGRIQQMASSQDVSKQAISAIATELEEYGYIQRQPDPEDARQVLLTFTPAGEQLISDSVASVDQLAEEFAAIIGKRPLRRLQTALANIYQALQLEQDVFGDSTRNDLQSLARQLNRQLGEQGARNLALLILSDTPDSDSERAT